MPQKNHYPFSNPFNVAILDQLENIIKPKKFSIVLDLDDTLIHATRIAPEKKSSLMKYIPLKTQPIGGGISQNVYVAIRPSLKEFLELVGSYFTIVIYTAAESEYADAI